MSQTKRVPEFYLIFFDKNINAYNFRIANDWILDKETGDISVYDASGKGDVYTYEWNDWEFSEQTAQYNVRERNKELLKAKKVLEKTK